MDAVEDLARKLIVWNQRKVAHLNEVAAAAKAGTTFVVGDAEVVASDREALFFQLGVEAALTEIGTLPIKITPAPKKVQRRRAKET
jgi:hypothetical protein